ncbi:MAG: hypothetical protein HYX86_01765 [Chloroflexi bacterium]|nr:hypothetical protein [Chloroflexota bacterium]
MDFREFLTILYRRWWMVVFLPLITLGSALVFKNPSTELWQATMRLTVGFAPPSGELTAEDLYNLALASEYLADDFSEVVKSQAFAQGVSQRVASQGITIDPGVLQGYTVAQKQHRILSIVITWPQPEEIAPIAQAARDALEQEGSKYFAQLGAGGAQIYVIDGPGLPGWAPVAVGPSLREQLDPLIRAGLGLLAGIGLALLLQYFDHRLYTAQEVEELGLRVIGFLPPH